MNPNELLDYFKTRQTEMIGAIREIVEIESPSYDVRRSLAVAEWIEKRVEEFLPGATTERIFAEKYGEHIIIRAFEDDGAAPFLLLGHTDTVHPVGSKAKNPTRVEDGKLYGCGTFDMKANIIVLFEALRALQEAGRKPLRPVTILLSCDEEIGSLTGRELVEREASRSATCFVFEPSADGRVKTGRKGTGMYRISARGVPSHAGLEPEKGVSAILEIARQIPRLHALADPSKGTTVNVCLMNGGTAANVIPENASCEVDVRFRFAEEAERVNRAIKDLKTFDPDATLLIEGEINRPPLEKTGDVETLYEAARAKAASFGYELGETEVGGASDGNFVAALGIPVLDGLGIRGNGAHTLQEFVYTDDIPNRATLCTLLLTAE